MSKVNKLSEESFVEQSAYQFAQKWAKSLEPGIKAGEELNGTLSKMTENYQLIKRQTLEFARLEKAFKVAPTRKEFTALIKEKAGLIEKNNEANKKLIELEKKLISIIEKKTSVTSLDTDILERREQQIIVLNKLDKQDLELKRKTAQEIEKLTLKRKESLKSLRALLQKKEEGKQLTEQENNDLKKAVIEIGKHDKALQENRLEKQRLLKLEKESAVLNSKTSSLIQRITLLRKKEISVIQDLTVKKELGTKLSDKEERALKKSINQFNRYDKAIKAAKTSTKQFQEYVGKYPTKFKLATASIKQFLPLIGAGFGFAQGVQVVKDSIGVVREFGKTMSTIAGIYRTNRKELGSLEDKIIEVAGASVNTATEVAKVAESLATLGKSKEEIEKLLEPVNNLSIGLNANADSSGEFLIQMLNTFGASIDEAEKYADTIATIRASTSLDFQNMVDSFQYLAPISNTLNKDLAYTGSLIGLLADNGIKAQRAGRLLGTAQQKLASSGKTLKGALEELNEAKKNNISELELLELATGLFGSEASSLGVILAENTDLIDKNAEAIRGNSGALDDLVKEQLTSLDSHFRILASRWEEYILNTNKSTGASNELKKALKFLSDNLSTIINVTFKAVKWIGIYKATVFLSKNAVAIATKVNTLYRLSIIAMNGGIKKAIISLKALRVASSASGLGLIVTLLGSAYELWQSFTEGAKEATKAVISVNKAFKAGADSIGSYLSRLETGLGLEIKDIKEREKNNLSLAKTEAEKIRIKKNALNEQQKIIDIKKAQVEKEIALREKDRKDVIERLKADGELDKRDRADISFIEGDIKKRKEYYKSLENQENEIIRLLRESQKRKKELSDKQREQLLKDSFSLKKYRLEQSIELEEEIYNNEASSYQKRIVANQQYVLKTIALHRIEAQQKIKEAKGSKDKIEEIEQRFQDKKTALEKQAEENSIKILEDYFKRKKELIDGQSEDSLLNNNLKEANDNLRDALKDEKLTLKQREELIKKHEENVARIKQESAKETLKNQIALIEKELQDEKYSSAQKAELARLLSGLKLSLSDLTTQGIIADTEKQHEANKKLHDWKVSQIQKASSVLADSLNLDASNLEHFLTGVVEGFGEGIDGILSGINSLSGIVGDIMGGIYDSNIENLENERQYWNEYYNEKYELAEGDSIQQDLIRKDQKKKEDELNKKKRKEQIKQAKFERDAAIFQIGINTAQALLKLWVNPGFPAAIPMSVLVGSLGLAQMAVVASKPLPKYAKGTEFHPGGHALVGEERPEVIIEPSKKPYVVYNPSILDLEAGTKVIPSLEEYERKMYMSNIGSLEFEGRKLREYQEKHEQNWVNNPVFNEILTETRLSRIAFEKSKPVKVEDNSDKIAEKIEHAIYRSQTINWD